MATLLTLLPPSPPLLPLMLVVTAVLAMVLAPEDSSLDSQEVEPEELEALVEDLEACWEDF